LIAQHDGNCSEQKPDPCRNAGDQIDQHCNHGQHAQQEKRSGTDPNDYRQWIQVCQYLASFILCSNVDVCATIRIFADMKHDRAATHLAVFDVRLAQLGHINQDVDALAAIRAVD